MSGRLAFAPAALAAAAFALGAVSGCGSEKSSESSAAASWADGLCSSLVTWRGSVKSEADQVRAEDISKASLEDAASGISSANAKLRDQLETLGKPPTAASSEARATVTQLSEELNTGADKIKDAAAGVSGAQEVLGAVSAISGTLTTMGDQLASAADDLRGLQGEETWKRAFGDSKACQELASR
jgi:hypothetical protein